MEEVFEFGQKLQAQGQFSEAEKCYTRYLEDNPKSFKAFNNLGIVVEQQERYDEALKHYSSAIALEPDSAVAHYNRGHALFALNQLDLAAEEFERVLRLDPNDGASKVNLGVIYRERGEIEPAEQLLLKATRDSDVGGFAWGKLGELYQEQQRFADGYDCHRQAAEKIDAPPHHFNAGICASLSKQHERAAKHFAEALELDPDTRIVHEHYVRSLEQLGETKAVAAALKQWSEHLPDDPICQHFIAAHDPQNTLTRCSEGYVRDTFNAFAGDYDATMHNLGYGAPQAIKQFLHTNNQQYAKVVDAGCGTGLCAAELREFSEYLIGVDLSHTMIAAAEQLNLYSELIADDLENYFQAHPNNSDLIVAADTFNYFGDLHAVFSKASDSLLSGGELLFTLEQHTHINAEYQLMSHGRFQHSRDYIEQCLSQNQFSAPTFTPLVLRCEAGVDVHGWLIHAKKGSA